MKLFSRIRSTATLPVLLATALLLLPLPSFGQATGTVTGIVADVTGAVIPNAAVVLTNEQNGIMRQTVSNGAGVFAFASVVPGTQYTVKVTAPKFTGWQSQPFALRPGDSINFSDIKLAVGAAATEVTIEATADAVRVVDSGERSDVITAKEISTLAVVGRDATELVRMLPGFAMSSGDQGLNNKPGYNTAVVGLSGAVGSFSANGSGTTGVSVVSDGASVTDIFSNAGTVQNPNIDMVEEVKISTSAFGAENNARSPAVINVVTKSGTSAFHGAGWFQARDTALNANDWYNNYLGEQRPDGRYFYPGGRVGGPVLLPHTGFNKKRDKMFFFFGYEYDYQRFSPATLGSWVPTLAERQGNFSQAALDAQLCGARPDGKLNPNANKAMCYTQNFLPDGLATAVANGNVVPYGNPNGVALVNWLPLPNADPFTNTSGYNYIQQIMQNQNGSQLHGKIDYNFSDNDRLFVSYGRQAQIAEDPVMMGYLPSNTMLYPGGVTTGDISNTISVNYVRVFSPRLTNELTIALSDVSQPGNMDTASRVSRFTANDYNCLDPVARAAGKCGTNGKGNFYFLGQYKNAGDYAMPALNNWGSLGYPNMLMPGGFYNNQVKMRKMVPTISETLSWVKGTHLLKAGFYVERGILNGLADNNGYPQGQFTFNSDNSYFMGARQVGQASNWGKCTNPDPAGQQRLSGASYIGPCMNPIALMYMGYADTWTQANYSPLVNMQYTTLSGFLSDSWKLRRNLTVTLGARFEHIGPWVDRHGNGVAVFSPALYKKQCNGRDCTSDMPGMTWHGQDPSVANTASQPSQVYFSPRLGIAYDVFGKGNTVLRGGWGVFRSQEEFMPYAMAAATAQGYKNSHLRGPLTYNLIDSWSPSNLPDFDAYVISPTDNKRPIHYEYNFTISQRMPWKSMLEIAYVGSSSDNLNTGQTSFSDLNLIPFGGLFKPGIDPFGDLPASYHSGGGNNDLGGLDTQGLDWYRTYPYYQHIYQIQHAFYSNYNSLQASWNKNSGPIQFGANYTFSKNLAVAASYNNILPDPFNARNDYNPTPWDRTHVFNVHYLVDIGRRYRGGNAFLGHVMNGWQISGISTLQSGFPLASVQGSNFGFSGGKIVTTSVPYATQMSSGASGYCQDKVQPDANGHRYCVEYMGNVVWLGTPDVLLMPTVLCNPTSNLGKNQYINPECFGLPMVTTNGAYRLPYIHGPAYLNHDLSVLKNFHVGEGKDLQFRLAAFNFLNHPLTSFNKNDTYNLTLGFQDAVPGQALKQQYLLYQNFGSAGIKYGARLVELSVKFQF